SASSRNCWASLSRFLNVRPTNFSRSSSERATPLLEATSYSLSSALYCSAGVAGLSCPSPSATDRLGIKTRIAHPIGRMVTSQILRASPVRRRSPRRLFLVFLRLLDQFFQGRVHGLGTRRAGPLVPDHALVIDDVECRRAGGLPLLGDGSLVHKRPP